MSDQPLESLDRFRKRSARLVLEEQGHHLAQTGCGGGVLVLRWRNPRRTIPLFVCLYTPGEAKVFLDGSPIEATGVDVAPGPHQLAVNLDGVDWSGGLFMFAALQETESYPRQGPNGLADSPWRLLSEADRTWLATLDEPVTGDWKVLDHDDAKWLALARSVPKLTPTWREPNALQMHWCNEFLAAFLALPPGQRGRGPVWVRKRFDLPEPPAR
jgi:hypothetical protein